MGDGRWAMGDGRVIQDDFPGIDIRMSLRVSAINHRPSSIPDRHFGCFCGNSFTHQPSFIGHNPLPRLRKMNG